LKVFEHNLQKKIKKIMICWFKRSVAANEGLKEGESRVIDLG